MKTISLLTFLITFTILATPDARALDFPIKNYEDMRARLCADADTAEFITCMKIYSTAGKLRKGEYMFIFDNPRYNYFYLFEYVRRDTDIAL